MKPKKFTLFFWKAETKKQGINVWAIRTGGRLVKVNEVILEVPVHTENRSRNPVAVVVGRGVVRVNRSVSAAIFTGESYAIATITNK